MKIVVNNLNKSFKNEMVINNLTYTFTSGNIYGIFGYNGSGKSVFLKILSGLYSPTSGEVLINGKNHFKDKTFCDDLGAMIEKPAFVDDLTGKENLILLSKIKNIINEEKIDNVIKIVNLLGQENKKYKKYSMGMKQKLAIAQAIMEDQKIIFLDEPFNGIDKDSIISIKNYLKSIKNDRLIIMTSHIEENFEDLIDIYLKFEDGKIIHEKRKKDK